MGDSDDIRVGIIGAGQNTRKMHIPKLMQIPGVKIVEVANRSVLSGKKVADELFAEATRIYTEENRPATWDEVKEYA